MPEHDATPAGVTQAVPSMLDLVRLSPRRLFPPGGIELYRQIALLTELSPGDEVLGVACGKGVSLAYFVTEHGVTAAGVDVDSTVVDEAERWSREEGLSGRLQFQQGRSDALPYRDDIFDLTIGEIGLANHCDPEAAVRELVRVTKPGGFVVLLQLVWKAPVDEGRRAILSEHMGARPLMLVEWKRIMKEAGVTDLHTEDWSDDETSFRPTVAKPFPDFAELFTLQERLGVLRRAWARWGLRGVTAALTRENAVHNLLTNERILGLDLLRGRKAAVAGPADALADEGVAREGKVGGSARLAGEGRGAEAPLPAHRGGESPPAAGGEADRGGEGAGGPDEDEREGGAPDTEGLPLFGHQGRKGTT